MAVAVKGTGQKAREVSEIKRDLIMKGKGDTLNLSLRKDLLKRTIEVISSVNEVAYRRFQSDLNNKVTKVLSGLIPAELRRSYKLHPEAFTPHPGFMYTTTSMAGARTIWVVPDLPVYLPQFTEMDTMREKRPAETEAIDRFVDAVIARKERLESEQAKLATSFASCRTQLALLNLNPAYWRVYAQLLEEEERAKRAIAYEKKEKADAKAKLAKRKAATLAAVRKKIAEDEKSRTFSGSE